MRFVLPLLALSFSVFTSVHAQEVIYADALSPVTVSLLPRDSGAGESESREVEQRTRPLLPFSLAGAREFANVPASIPTIAPPPMRALFQATTERDLYPADAAGAVGRNHVLGVTNQGITIQKRSGELVASVSVAAFMGAPPEDKVDYYDARAAYDAVSDRFVVICLRAVFASDLIIAVSQTGDPSGTWSRYKIHYDQIARARLDFSHIAMTRDTVVFTTNEAGAYAVGMSMRKNDLYAAPATLPITTYAFDADDVVPVENDETGVAYVVSHFGTTRLDRLPLQWTPRKHASCSCGLPIAAPQQSTTSGIDPGYGDIEAAVYRAGAIYGVRAIATGSPLHDAIWWWKADAETGVILDEGFIDDSTGATFYAYPSLAVNHAHEMLIGFSVFARDKYPSAGYVFRDAAGRISRVAAMKDGNSAYLGHKSSFDPGQRWGDYTTTVLDPLSASAFWTTQIVTASGKWSAWWAKVEAPLVRRRAARK